MDNKNTKEIIALIEKIADKRLKEKFSNMEKVYDGVIIQSSQTSRLMAKVKGEEYEISNQGNGIYLRNESGKELVAGSIVRVYAKDDNFNNAYIGVVFDQNNTNKPNN